MSEFGSLSTRARRLETARRIFFPREEGSQEEERLLILRSNWRMVWYV